VREVRQDPRGHIVAATHDDIGAERGDEGVISFGRVGDDCQPFGLGQLHDIAAVRPCGSGHGECLSGRQAEQVERLPGREAVHGQRARLDMRGAGRRRDHRARVQDNLFAVGAVAPLGDHHGHDCIPNLHTRGDPGTDLVDDPGRVHTRHVGRRVNLLLLGM
jgi:hypothetical protein